ncbi:TetR/AcrR family transcriptional regulator [Rubrivivax sp. A210]|uniref:TetR/AcrR family transcriptional regulator n=1 Tax=Rubrivivax sp. A210 TaxID=2772301 RepID=UPI00191B01FA|nr:TetR/AcrR family transcriptional regulator [Rubrivivax sp. A210]CAD5367017.1 TetR/AcrR family transcriptional regulator [Rubrivivax sp. A210]
MLQVRHEAIIDTVNRLLAERGYDMMTVDEVAADVGIAKASLYKHFASKEALAAAAMKRVQERALAQMDALQARPEARAVEHLRGIVRWALQTQSDGQMPSLPSQNSALRNVLTADKDYMDLLMQVSDRLGAWILQAQRDGDIDAELPPELVLFTIFARACDPVLPALKAAGHAPEQVIDWVLRTCFSGLAGPGAASAPRAATGGKGRSGKK